VWRFENGGEPELWLSSADWMPRNMEGRIEAAFPVIEPALRARVEAVLDVQLKDDVKARVLLPDGTSARPPAGTMRAQTALIERSREMAQGAG
jgi:polyphosphate kinase